MREIENECPITEIKTVTRIKSDHFPVKFRIKIKSNKQKEGSKRGEKIQNRKMRISSTSRREKEK